MHEIPGIFETVRQSLRRRYQEYVTVSERNFEHLMQTFCQR